MTQVVQQPATSSATPANAVRPVLRRDRSRLVVFFHALAFVIGFGVVFTLLGLLAGLISQSLDQGPLAARTTVGAVEDALRRLGAILLAIFGLVTLGVFRWLASWIRGRIDLAKNPAAAALVDVLEFFNGLLYTERRMIELHRVNRGWGYLSSALMGVGFAAGWTPCIGPILSAIWVLAGQSGTLGQGAALLAVYSLGLGIPFLITGAAFSSTTPLLRRLNRHAHVVSMVSGLFLLFVAYLLWTNGLTTLINRFDLVAQLMSAMNRWVLAGEEWMTVTSGGDLYALSTLAAAPLAFFAGLLSFLSPCWFRPTSAT
jgi:cytochrome c-type biogenesis protein